MADTMLGEMDEPPTGELVKRTENRLDHALRRMEREGWVGRAGKAGNANLWSLAGKAYVTMIVSFRGGGIAFDELERAIRELAVSLRDGHWQLHDSAFTLSGEQVCE